MQCQIGKMKWLRSTDQRCGKQTIWIRIRVGEMVWIQYTGWKNYANPDQGYELEKLCKMIRIRIRDAGKQNDMDLTGYG